MSPKKTPPTFASATNTSTADELLGKLVGFRVIESRVIETKLGESEATVCQILDIGDGDPTDLGERPVFWQVVRRQLAAHPEAEWVCGRLVQSGQAYRLDELTDEDTAAVRRALLAIAA